ncbi:MAG: type IV pilin protein [Phycisphaerales bacterium]
MRRDLRHLRRAFTLIELIAVIVVLAILSGIAIPRYINYRDRARQTADEASIAGINTALGQRYMLNRSTDAASSSWITAASSVANVMDTGQLPFGITVSGSNFTDQRGNTYTFTAETSSNPARLALSVAPSGGGSGGSGGGSGAASMPAVMLVLASVPWMARPRRRESVR